MWWIFNFSYWCSSMQWRLNFYVWSSIFSHFSLVTGSMRHLESAFNICFFGLVQDLQKVLNIDISALFGDIGRKFMRASLKLRISNDIANLAFIRHIISYYSFHWTAAAYTQESMESLISLRDHLPKLKEIHKYFKENDISSLNKFVRKYHFRYLMMKYRNYWALKWCLTSTFT